MMADTLPAGPLWAFKSEKRVEPFAYAGVLSAVFHLGGTG
jgi:hypothetical protein